MLICPRKFKRCWSPRKFANFANICFPPLELTFFWRICRLLCSSIFFCIDFNFLATQYVLDVSQAWKISNLWSIGKLVNCPNNQRQKLSTKPQKLSIILTGKILKKGYMYFTRSTLTYYIILLNIIFYWNWLKRGHFTIFLTGSEKDQTVILFSNIS